MDIIINENTLISDNIVWDNINNYINTNVSIIYIGSNATLNDKLLSLHKNREFDKLIIISKSDISDRYPRLFVDSFINNNILQHVKKNCLIIVKLSNDYDDMKWIVRNLIKLYNLTFKLNLHLGIIDNNCNYLGFIENFENSKYSDDFITCLKCLFIFDKKQQYEYIYNTVCEYLDNQFCKGNICDFKNDQCIANRENKTAHKDMGCCYSFEYCKVFDPRFIKNVKLCQHLKNKTCSTKCITCKLFTCKYLKERGIKFDTHKILLLDCYFNKKQHLILNSNFFQTRDAILQKLLENNYDLYFWYVLFKKYMI